MLRMLLLLLILVYAAPVQAFTVGYLPGAGELDSPFNELAYMGLARAEDDFGFKLVARQGLEGFTDDREAKAQMQALLEMPVDVVVANGIEWRDTVETVAPKHPEKRFVIVDAELRGLPNVVSVLFANEEGGFLAGCLAGYMSSTKRVGFIGGVAIPTVRAFRHGFAQGLAYADPEVAMLTRYVSQGSDFSGFYDQQVAFQLAKNLYSEGVDIIFPVAGEAGLAVLNAAKELDRYAIGIDYDQDHLAKGHILASVLKRVDKAVYEELQLITRDQFQAGVHVYGLRDGGIGLSEMQYTRDHIPQAVQERLLEVQEKLKHGVIDLQKLPVSPTSE